MRPYRSLQVFIVLYACVLMGLYRSLKVFIRAYGTLWVLMFMFYMFPYVLMRPYVSLHPIESIKTHKEL